MGDNADIEKAPQPSTANYQTNKTSIKVEKVYRNERDIDEQSLSELKQSLSMMVPGPNGKIANAYASVPVGRQPPVHVKPDKKVVKEGKNGKDDKETRISVLNSDSC